MREWREKNKEHLYEYNKQYVEKNKKRVREWHREYISALPEDKQIKRLNKKKEYRINNSLSVKKSQRNSTLKKKYGIDLDAFNLLMLKQDNTCPVCLRLFEDKVDPCVDHCHITNKIRGILCRQCNAAIGQLGDTEECLQRALSYLQHGVVV